MPIIKRNYFYFCASITLDCAISCAIRLCFSSIWTTVWISLSYDSAARFSATPGFREKRLRTSWTEMLFDSKGHIRLFAPFIVNLSHITDFLLTPFIQFTGCQCVNNAYASYKLNNTMDTALNRQISYRRC